MLNRFDHAVIGVRSLDAALAIWRDRLGFDAQPGGRHTGRGTQNGIVRFGLDYIELISIYDSAEVEGRNEANALALASLVDRAEGGMLGFALATDDIVADAARFRGIGFDLIGPAPMERLRPDGRLLKWRLLVAEGGSWGKPLPFFIQWDVPDDARLSWERPGSHAIGATAVSGIAITVANLDRAIDMYERQLGLPLLVRDEAPNLGASRARFRIGNTTLELLGSAGVGAVADAIAENVERLWQITLTVRDLAVADRFLRTQGVRLSDAPGTPGGILIAPEDALQARIVLIEG